MEFMLGIISALFGVWVVAINKFRFSLYEKKVDFYFKINCIFSDLLTLDSDEDAAMRIAENKHKIKAMSLIIENSIFISDNISELCVEYLTCNFSAQTRTPEYEKTSDLYIKVQRAIKSDIGISLLEFVNLINTRTPAQTIEKLRLMLIQRRSPVK